MCHFTENLHRCKSAAVTRASEDFFPGKPESHTVHLASVACNSLFLGEICLPDWDTCHSLHESAALHAVARAIGGCPVRVSDEPGQHDTQLLRKLVMHDGSVLRAEQPGRPTRDRLFEDVTSDETSALKTWNENSHGGAVGAFDVQGAAWNFDAHGNDVLDPSPPRLLAEVKPHDVESLKDTPGSFVAWRHRSSTLEFLPTGNSVATAPLEQHGDWEIFTVAPIQAEDNCLWAPVGLADMMNTGGALLLAGTLDRDSLTSSMRVRFESRGPGRFVGRFVAFANVPQARVLLDNKDPSGTNLPCLHDGETGELSITPPSEASEGSAHHVTVEWD